MKKFLIFFLFSAFLAQSCKDDSPIVDTQANMLTDITSTQQFNQNIETGVSLIFYHASWCTKCKAQRPAVEAVAERAEFSEVFFGEVEYEDFSEIVGDRNIQGFPTVVVYKDNNEEMRFSGQGHTEQQFVDALNKALEKM